MNYSELINKIKQCRECHSISLVENSLNSRPLFQQNEPSSFDILFVLEAPNKDDTINPSKGYITISDNTDPTGKLFNKLFKKELELAEQDLFITNSVLCLPKKNIAGKYPVPAEMSNRCQKHLRDLILNSNPKIVCPLGLKALKSLNTNLLEKHNLCKMSEAVGKEINWFGRVLFPLYHTSLLARNKRNGRPIELQREDWRKLRLLYNRLKN